jgi:hypothetical protein
MPAAPFAPTGESPSYLTAYPRRRAGRHSTCPSFNPVSSTKGMPTSDIVEGFRDAGGVLSADALITLLRPHVDQPISKLAKWIVAREVVSFDSASRTLLPLAQFDLKTMTVKRSWSQIVELLAPAFDDLELADWLTRSNSWLSGATPVGTMEHDTLAVMHAARADRFIALG